MGGIEQWLSQVNWIDIVYRVAAALIAAIVLNWAGVFRRVKTTYRLRKARRNYQRILTEECSTLIVIGRRKGFSMDDVFIPLDTAPSELMARVDEKIHGTRPYPRGSYILVGGPGAGKSTLTKKEVLDRLSRSHRHIPLFIRLREYVAYESVEHCLLAKLQHAKYPSPETVLQRELSSGYCFCVLDGLDEVRPQLREKVYRDINHFYNTHFAGQEHSKLVVTCRKEAYRGIPLDIPQIWEVRPLSDEQISRFAEKWPPKYPPGKSAETFLRDLEASPRIHELARSPLLLVGGLTQYTESNQGIPEERFEYLSRVAKWLVSEWAMAQSHPPDPNRPIYDRVLACLAFHMHKAQRPDLPRDEAVALIKQCLPTFGLSADDADGILETIGTKTGILINQAQNTVVFAQFGLQEYFASLEALPTLGLSAFCKLQPRDWWREVILLTTAQQREPTALLNRLFGEDAMLAAACVAECPTPSVALQERATDACLKGVDANDEAASSALVPLLRKLKSTVEIVFCGELEKRLKGDKTRSSIVGIALATAGTEQATAALARHPEIWEACLKNAGYLSSNFEHRLIDWIKDGDDTQSGRASELISARLSGDRFRQLVEILSSLKPNRAERLAGLLIRCIDDRMEEHWYGPTYTEEWSLSILGHCVPFIRNREDYLLSRYRIRRSSPKRLNDDTDAIATALFLESNGQRFTSEQVQRYLLSCLKWARSRGALLIWLAGGLSLMIPALPAPYWPYGLLLPAVLLVASASRPYGTLPWMRRYGWPVQSTLPLMTIGVFLCGICLALIGSAPMLFPESGRVTSLSTCLMGLTCGLLGLLVHSQDYFSILHVGQSDDLGMKCPKAMVSRSLPIVLTAILFFMTVMGFIVDISSYMHTVTPVVGAAFAAWPGFLVLRLGLRLRSVKIAHSRATVLLAQALKWR